MISLSKLRNRWVTYALKLTHNAILSFAAFWANTMDTLTPQYCCQLGSLWGEVNYRAPKRLRANKHTIQTHALYHSCLGAHVLHHARQASGLASGRAHHAARERVTQNVRTARGYTTPPAAGLTSSLAPRSAVYLRASQQPQSSFCKLQRLIRHRNPRFETAQSSTTYDLLANRIDKLVMPFYFSCTFLLTQCY